MGLFKFFRRTDFIPSDEFLTHELSNKYFYRKMPFRLLDKNKIVAFDPNSPRMITFDPWPEGIFLNANGKLMLKQFLINTAKLYKGNVPDTLEKTIIEETEKLISNNFIAISDTPIELDKTLLFPHNNT
jgi:hypothetical protein